MKPLIFGWHDESDDVQFNLDKSPATGELDAQKLAEETGLILPDFTY